MQLNVSLREELLFVRSHLLVFVELSRILCGVACSLFSLRTLDISEFGFSSFLWKDEGSVDRHEATGSLLVSMENI